MCARGVGHLPIQIARDGCSRTPARAYTHTLLSYERVRSRCSQLTQRVFVRMCHTHNSSTFHNQSVCVFARPQVATRPAPASSCPAVITAPKCRQIVSTATIFERTRAYLLIKYLLICFANFIHTHSTFVYTRDDTKYARTYR
jgi:hypothetical protein